MLATLFNKKSKNSEIGYSILAEKDTRRIKKLMEIAKLERTESFRANIESVTILWNGAAALVKTSEREIHLTIRSAWDNTPSVKAVQEVIAITQSAERREQERLTAKQQETAKILQLAIQQRRAVLAAA